MSDPRLPASVTPSAAARPAQGLAVTRRTEQRDPPESEAVSGTVSGAGGSLRDLEAPRTAQAEVIEGLLRFEHIGEADLELNRELLRCAAAPVEVSPAPRSGAPRAPESEAVQALRLALWETRADPNPAPLLSGPHGQLRGGQRGGGWIHSLPLSAHDRQALAARPHGDQALAEAAEAARVWSLGVAGLLAAETQRRRLQRIELLRMGTALSAACATMFMTTGLLLTLLNGGRDLPLAFCAMIFLNMGVYVMTEFGKPDSRSQAALRRLVWNPATQLAITAMVMVMSSMSFFAFQDAGLLGGTMGLLIVMSLCVQIGFVFAQYQEAWTRRSERQSELASRLSPVIGGQLEEADMTGQLREIERTAQLPANLSARFSRRLAELNAGAPRAPLPNGAHAGLTGASRAGTELERRLETVASRRVDRALRAGSDRSRAEYHGAEHDGARQGHFIRGNSFTGGPETRPETRPEPGLSAREREQRRQLRESLGALEAELETADEARRPEIEATLEDIRQALGEHDAATKHEERRRTELQLMVARERLRAARPEDWMPPKTSEPE